MEISRSDHKYIPTTDHQNLEDINFENLNEDVHNYDINRKKYIEELAFQLYEFIICKVQIERIISSPDILQLDREKIGYFFFSGLTDDEHSFLFFKSLELNDVFIIDEEDICKVFFKLSLFKIELIVNEVIERIYSIINEIEQFPQNLGKIKTLIEDIRV